MYTHQPSGYRAGIIEVRSEENVLVLMPTFWSLCQHFGHVSEHHQGISDIG